MTQKLVDSVPSTATLNSNTLVGVTSSGRSHSATLVEHVVDGKRYPEFGGVAMNSSLQINLTLVATHDTASTPNALATLLEPGDTPGTLALTFTGKGSQTLSRTDTYATVAIEGYDESDDGQRRQQVAATFRAFSSDGSTSIVGSAWA